MKLEPLYDDNHVLVVNKPAGLPTQGSAKGERSLASDAKDYIKHRYGKPGNVFLGVVSRLDALVTGICVFARTSKSAARLSEQFRERRVVKTYWAAVRGEPAPHGELLENWLQKDDELHRMVVSRSAAGNPNNVEPTQLARLSYCVLQKLSEGLSVLEVTLETGRKHQIRVQLSHRGLPIVGDAKYGSCRSFGRGIALHARQLTFTHPTLNTRLSFIAPVPPAWESLGFSGETGTS